MPICGLLSLTLDYHSMTPLELQAMMQFTGRHSQNRT
jgi:hypothetical protein